MNYCPLGSMHSANPGRHERLVPKKARKAKDESQEIYNDGKDIAEPLVWKWFEDLAKACLLLEKGKDLPSGSVSRLSGHHVIVHRDIKPPNIFLDLPSGIDGDWPEYPVATLGDFGKYNLILTLQKYHLLTTIKARHATPTTPMSTTRCPTTIAKEPPALGL